MKITQKVIVTTLSYVVTTLVGFFGTIYFTNVLGAALFGKYVLGVTIIKWLIISDCGVRKATIKRISEGDKINKLYTASLIIHFFQAIVVINMLYIFSSHLNDYIGGKFFSLILFLFIMMLMFELVGMAISGMNKVHIFKTIDTFHQIARIGFQFGLLVFGYGITGLFLGHVFAFGVAFIIAAYLLMFQYEIRLVAPARDQFISIFRYAKFSWLARVRSQTFARMDILIMGFFIASSEVAVYQVAWTISMVFAVLSQSIQANLFPELSNLSAESMTENISSLVKQGLIYAGFIPIPGLFGSIVLGEDVLAMFGPKFTSGMPLLVALAALSVISTVDSQLRNAINSLNYPEFTFRINTMFIITNLCLNIILVYYVGAIGAAIASFITVTASTIYAVILLRSIISFSIPWRTILQQVFAGIVMAGAVWGIKQAFLLRSSLVIISVAGFGAVTYTLILILISVEIRTKVLEMIEFTDLGD